MTSRVFILGFVQGVGFRRFVKKNALGLGLKGWVKNLPDGRVEALVQGSKENIEKLVKLCEKGTFFSDIKSVQVEWGEDSDVLLDFQILH
jgi:acylphosphatase